MNKYLKCTLPYVIVFFIIFVVAGWVPDPYPDISLEFNIYQNILLFFVLVVTIIISLKEGETK